MFRDFHLKVGSLFQRKCFFYIYIKKVVTFSKKGHLHTSSCKLCKKCFIPECQKMWIMQWNTTNNNMETQLKGWSNMGFLTKYHRSVPRKHHPDHMPDHLTLVSGCTSSRPGIPSVGLSLVYSRLARSFMLPPRSHTRGFFPSFEGFGLFL